MATAIAAISLVLILGMMMTWMGPSAGWAYDFQAYHDAALRLLETGSPYQEQTLSGPFRPGPGGLYLYSPILALVLAPLTNLQFDAAALTWLALRLVALAATCALMPVRSTIRIATFCAALISAPVLFDLNLGNVSLLVTLAAVVMWRYLDKPAAAIALAASLTLRPTMAVIAAWWLMRGLWRPVAWALGAGLAMLLLSLTFVAPGVWGEYLTVLRNVSDVTGVRSNVDLGSAVLMMEGPTWLATIALFVGYAVAIGASLFSLRRDRELSFVVTLMATLLMAPLLWEHYLTNLLIPAAFLAGRGRTWGLILPLLGWTPTLIAMLIPSLRGSAEAVLPLIALLGVLAPFLAPSRGEPAGWFANRLGGHSEGVDEKLVKEPAPTLATAD
ncbi:MAG TPA: glycosyltransferase 87 family protein [Candidatus Limnocylindrales bacterium]|nr:glycosyltransferase 87 family protein [Candidatus Limnocylindrales bacterium]